MHGKKVSIRQNNGMDEIFMKFGILEMICEEGAFGVNIELLQLE